LTELPETRPESYTAIFDGLVLGWKTMEWWCPTGFFALEMRGFRWAADTPAALIASMIRWLTATPLHSLTESFLVASYVMLLQECKPTELPPLAATTRKIRVVFADRLRRGQLNTWPKVLAAATAEWTPEMLSRLAFKYARSTGLMMQMNDDYAAKLQVVENGAKDTGQEPDERPNERADRMMEAHRMANLQAAMSLVDDAADEIGALRAERDRLRQERDRFADRHARVQSRIESLERELGVADEARRDAQHRVDSLTKERDGLAEQLAIVRAVELALSPGAPALPSDVLKDRRVMVFTGLESGDARDGLAERFYAFGAARVDCYWTDKERGPDLFPSDAIIAIDLRFMGHSDSHTIEQRARSAGAWYYRGRHGTSTMAQATAAAFLVHRDRMSQ
jgi:hypothetical protein